MKSKRAGETLSPLALGPIIHSEMWYLGRSVGLSPFPILKKKVLWEWCQVRGPGNHWANNRCRNMDRTTVWPSRWRRVERWKPLCLRRSTAVWPRSQCQRHSPQQDLQVSHPLRHHCHCHHRLHRCCHHHPHPLPPAVQDPMDPTAMLSEVEAERRLAMMADHLKTDALTPPPYVHDLKSLEVHQHPSFVDVNDTAKTLEAYIQVIETFAGRQSALVVVPYLPKIFGSMQEMLAKLPLVDTQDCSAVHCQRCIAIGRMLQNVSLQTHAAAWSGGLQQLPKHFLGRMCPYFKDLTKADFEPLCRDLLKQTPPQIQATTSINNPYTYGRSPSVWLSWARQ